MPPKKGLGIVLGDTQKIAKMTKMRPFRGLFKSPRPSFSPHFGHFGYLVSALKTIPSPIFLVAWIPTKLPFERIFKNVEWSFVAYIYFRLSLNGSRELFKWPSDWPHFCHFGYLLSVLKTIPSPLFLVAWIPKKLPFDRVFSNDNYCWMKFRRLYILPV